MSNLQLNLLLLLLLASGLLIANFYTLKERLQALLKLNRKKSK